MTWTWEQRVLPLTMSCIGIDMSANLKFIQGTWKVTEVLHMKTLLYENQSKTPVLNSCSISFISS